jgi:ATP-dependent RNA helicase DHX29
MAGGSKKKKKPAANPNRGFATTSTASKPKPEEGSQATSTDPSNVATPADASSAVKTSSSHPNQTGLAAPERELHELNPDELEAQLEASELQQFVEKHGAKVKKETARQVTRLQTDRRLLRGQADFLSVKDWLPDELMQQILDLTLADLKHESNTEKKSSSPVGDDLVAKVWQLRQCLLDLAIPLDRVNEVVGWAISNPPADSSASLAWGLEECFEWLALHCEVGELEVYDFTRQKITAVASDEPEEASDNTEPEDWKTAKKKRDSPVEMSEKEGSSPSVDDDIDVSDVESDMEPDELLSVYLRTKAKLYELNPAADTPGKSKTSKASKTPSRNANKTSGERKLEQKLAKIEGDVLFDKREADYHWGTQKIELAREVAERKKLQLQSETKPSSVRTASPAKQEDTISDEAERLGQELLAETAEIEDGGDLLSGMFDALPGVDQSSTVENGAVSGNVTVRDFGKLIGMNPKRVLEEACKSRDTRCKQSYKMVSPTTYASRHSVTIQWTKEQEAFESAFLPDVAVIYKPGRFTFTMTGVAAPETAQSEAYIATAALFLVFSGSPKEEKAHLRLPPAYRNLWDEFAVLKQNHIHAEDCTTVKEVRALIEQHHSPDDDDDDEVVFNANLRRRLDGASGASTPVKRPEARKAAQPVYVEELAQMWQRKISTPAYQRMLIGRMNLPMFHFRAAALDTIQRHQVTILCGETGCGKSTQLPAFILEHELANGRPCKVYCTEPRRISAISLAQRVSEEMGENKGDVGTFRSLVGYSIRLESNTTAQTRLVYATVGIVLRMLENSDGLSDITHLILDEVSDRLHLGKSHH